MLRDRLETNEGFCRKKIKKIGQVKQNVAVVPKKNVGVQEEKPRGGTCSEGKQPETVTVRTQYVGNPVVDYKIWVSKEVQKGEVKMMDEKLEDMIKRYWEDYDYSGNNMNNGGRNRIVVLWKRDEVQITVHRKEEQFAHCK
ncbi:OLC1v1036300C1 [Oldenlandia corymbosa var. corymbosa]|uniref:OLC1v1036300C1 n=1 Tax=Oldenlandia corymbosa var. corymbosa TaxID=529605 RepID=A0AAV1CW36_OLDCO|nr:OLC1v1036300C1 [Oldenlandia corymbosa var. corymbosa]